MNRPTEIGNLEVTLEIQEKIFRFDVPVDDISGVAVDESICQLSHILGRANLIEAALGHLLEEFVHLTSGRVLQDEVDSGLVPEVS